MGEDQRTASTEHVVSDDGTRSPEQIRDDIEHTREELGETVAALADKADVKAHAKARIDETKARVDEATAKAGGPPALLVAGIVVAGLIAWRLARRD